MAKRLRDHEYLQTVPRPVAAMAKTYPAGYSGYFHSHARAQFLYAASGTMKLTMDAGCWIIPPGRAAWLPAGFVHQTGSIGQLEMRTLYILPTAISAPFPEAPRMLRVSPLLHELVLRAIAMPIEYDEHGQDGQIMKALLGEIDWSPNHPVSLPSIRDTRLKRMEKALLIKPGEHMTLEEWALKLRMSTRTLSRLVRKETHLTFRAWRDQIRAFVAIPMLTESRPLLEIAGELGYDTAWAFTAMFKRITGITPSKYAASE
jgi:AraC-like DNA-binding protein